MLLTLGSFFALEAGQVQVSGQWRASQQDVVSLIRSHWVSVGPKSNMTVIVIEEGKFRHEARGTQRHRVKIVT